MSAEHKDSTREQELAVPLIDETDSTYYLSWEEAVHMVSERQVSDGDCCYPA